MRKVGLVVDSTFGLSKAYVKENNISSVALNVSIDNENYIDGEFRNELVVEALIEKKDVKTSSPAPDLFIKAYQEQLKKYDSVICLTLSSALSGTFGTAHLAKNILDNPNVYVVDSKTTISGGAFLAEKLIEYLNEGHSVTEGLTYLEEIMERGFLLFTIDNLQTLVKTGRIGKIKAVIGNILKIKPILKFKQGVLELEHKVRSFSNVFLYLINEAKKLIDYGKVIVRISFVDKESLAHDLKTALNDLSLGFDVRVSGIISPVVSAHVGLGGLGVYLTYE